MSKQKVRPSTEEELFALFPIFASVYNPTSHRKFVVTNHVGGDSMTPARVVLKFKDAEQHITVTLDTCTSYSVT